MRKRSSYAGLMIALFVLAAGSTTTAGDDARRGPDLFMIELDGFQENPSVSTTGVGRLDLRIHDETEIIEFVLSYSDLEGVLVPDGRVLAAHIHLGARHVNGGVSAFLCGGGGKLPCPTPEGTVTGMITASDIVGPSAQGINAGEATAFAELVRAIRAGFTYANVHTTRWPGGEVRGQIGDRSGTGD